MILVVGLSPAWQRTLEFTSLRPGAVNRARQVTESASGKGVNVARVAVTLGAEVRLVTVVGGPRGEMLDRALQGQGIQTRLVRVAVETRVCQTLVTNHGVTELVEECGPLGREEVAEVRAMINRQLPMSKLLVLTGTVPEGCGEDFYAQVTRDARAAGIEVLVDTQGRQLMNTLREQPFLVRINRDELAAAAGSRGKLGARWQVISGGPRQVHVRPPWGGEGWTFCPPRVHARNPVGSGDAMLAGLACGLWRGESVIAAVRWGIACGAANALMPTAGVIRTEDVSRLVGRVGGPAA